MEAALLKVAKDKLSKAVREASDGAYAIEKKVHNTEAALKRSAEEKARLLGINKALVAEVEEHKAKAKASKAEARIVVRTVEEKMAML